MTSQDPFTLVYDPQVKGHLQAIESKYHALIRASIEEQLLYEPQTETRNRKPLQQPVAMEATWELRFGPNNRFRVFYAVDPDRHEVQVLAIGVKERNRLTLGGHEVDL